MIPRKPGDPTAPRPSPDAYPFLVTAAPAVSASRRSLFKSKIKFMRPMRAKGRSSSQRNRSASVESSALAYSLRPEHLRPLPSSR